MYYSDDFFKTKTKLLKGGNKFFLNEKLIIATEIGNDGLNLLMSKSYLIDYNFKKVKIDNVTLRNDNKFTIMSATDTTLFLNLYSYSLNDYGTVYKSNINADEFTKVIDYNVKSSDDSFDFEKVIVSK